MDVVVESSEKLSAYLAAVRADPVASWAQVRMLESQVRILQDERITHLQQIHTLREVTEYLDRRFTKVLAELAELRADAAVAIRKDLDEQLAKRLPVPPPTPAPKPPSPSHDKTVRAKPGRHAHGRNTQAPPGLVIEETDVNVAQCSGCGSDDLRVRETVDRTAWHYVRGHFKQRVEHCRTVQCNQCLARTTAEGSPRPFPRAACTTELVVHVGYSKYGLFLPLERQLWEFRRLGLPVSQATLVDWIRRLSEIIAPVVAVLWSTLMSSDVLTFDGTGLKVLKKGGGKAHHGHLYVFASGDVVVYKYLETKHGARLESTLSAFGGVGVADAEAANNAVFASGERVEAGCNAHAFRKFRDCLDHDLENASDGMAWIAAMYRQEATAKEKGLKGAGLLEFRKRHIAPIANVFRQWLDAKAADLLPESSVGKAVRYYRTQWENLTRFLTDPSIPIDNNDSERALKLAALLRKNCLFAGSEAGADRAALNLTLVETCRRVGVDTEQYLVWLVDQRARRRGTPAEHQVNDLTPHAYRDLTQAQKEQATGAG